RDGRGGAGRSTGTDRRRGTPGDRGGDGAHDRIRRRRARELRAPQRRTRGRRAGRERAAGRASGAGAVSPCANPKLVGCGRSGGTGTVTALAGAVASAFGRGARPATA